MTPAGPKPRGAKRGHSFADVCPDLAHEAHGWDPSLVSAKSNIKQKWKCSNGHVYEADPAHRCDGRGCPFCSNKKVLPGFNDLFTTHPGLAKEAYNWDPTEVVAGSNKKKDWQCSVGHIWSAQINNRVRGSGCPYCAGRLVKPGFNDLATTRPDLAKQLIDDNGTGISKSSHKRRTWECELGHRWEATVADRSAGYGCPFCAGQRVLKGFNDLATVRPEIAKQANGWNPSEVTEFNDVKRSWKCEFGHAWLATTAARSRGTGCPICVNKVIQVGFNDLATTHPEIALQAHGWDPRLVTRGSHSERQWECAAGHLWLAAVKDRVAGYGCPSCASSGYSQLSDGYLYLIEQDLLQMLQIGISNFPEQRLAQHAKRGWVALDVRGPMDGLLARQLEQHLLAMLKKRGVRFADETDVEKFDGWTEAWLTVDLKIEKLRDLLEMLHEEESI